MVLERLSLTGKVAVVTGGGTGLGRAMSLSLARAGAAVAIAGRRPQPLQETVTALQQLGRRSLAVPTDITIPAQVTHLMQAVLTTLGRVDIYVEGGVMSHA